MGRALAMDRRLEKATQNLLERAGGGLAPTQAADELGVAAEDVLKSIERGAMLAMRRPDGSLVLPRVQFEGVDGGLRVIGGLEHAIGPFLGAGEGGWAALQWLLAHDPNLAASPLEALRDRRFAEVEAAARHYVGEDEGR